MALSLSLEYKILVDGTKVYVTDKTGSYSATNTGGWGSPNYNLYDSCLLCLPIRKGSSGDSLFEAVNPASYYIYDISALNTEEKIFEFVFESDGVIDFCLMRLPVSTNHTTFTTGGSIANGDYYLYDGTSDGIYKKVGASYVLIDPADYKLIPYDTNVTSQYIVKTISSDITTPQLAIKAQSLYKDYIIERKKNCDDAEPLFQEILKLHEDIRGSYYTFWSNLPVEAQNQVEDLLDKYELTPNA